MKNYKFPTTELLNDYSANVSTEAPNEDVIVNTLNNYGVKIDSIKHTSGPSTILYELVPAPGVRISKIKNLEDDIALSLGSTGIRIIAPMPGKGTVGIEVPKMSGETVSMKSLIESDEFVENNYELPIALGKTTLNEPYITDLTKMPHMLVAGATGQGKSVGINTMIASLLYSKRPEELKFVLIDPKKVELSLYSKIEKQYLAKLDGKDSIVTDMNDVTDVLESLTSEMDSRYELLMNSSVRNIVEYNNKSNNKLPYIVVVIDEFADMMMVNGKEVEKSIVRLAQLARAVGIHLIVATQRPSADVITGLIKTNFPTRVSFKVSSRTDSQVILDSKGAEQLIGRGDMIVSNGGVMTRVQGAFVDTSEIVFITEYISSQENTEQFMLPSDSDEEVILDDKDSLYEDAVELSNELGSVSVRTLQINFKIGYNRAVKLMNQLNLV